MFKPTHSVHPASYPMVNMARKVRDCHVSQQSHKPATCTAAAEEWTIKVLLRGHKTCEIQYVVA
jgi:hypothetical protein